MSQFKVGDLVEFNQDFGEYFKGDQAVIKYLHGDTTATLEVGPNKRYACPFQSRISKVHVEQPEAPVEAKRDLLRMIAATSKRVGSRNRDAILKSLMEECGELATECSIEDGTKNRAPSPDGVGGEGIDVLVVIVDLLHLTFGEQLHSEAFLDRVQAKLNKWEGK